MDTDKNIDHLREQNPFRVPDGYFEGLTDQIMTQLPNQSVTEKDCVITWLDRVRPLLYLAAVFIGLGFFFKLIAPQEEKKLEEDSLLVKLGVLNKEKQDTSFVDSNDYIEYMEEQYIHESMYEANIFK